MTLWGKVIKYYYHLSFFKSLILIFSKIKQPIDPLLVQAVELIKQQIENFNEKLAENKQSEQKADYDAFVEYRF